MSHTAMKCSFPMTGSLNGNSSTIISGSLRLWCRICADGPSRWNGIPQRIFQKNAPAYYPTRIKTVSLPKKNGVVRHVVCDDKAALVHLASQAVITPHAWLSRIDKRNHPDQMIFDLDPSSEDFGVVCDAAKRLPRYGGQERRSDFFAYGTQFLRSDCCTCVCCADARCPPVAVPLKWNELDSERLEPDLLQHPKCFRSAR
jgi:DNA primase